MRRHWMLGLTLVCGAAMAAGCGGGSGGGSPGTATLKGAVTLVDGQTSGLDGVVFRLLETGDVVASGSDGSFSFGEVPTGVLRIQLASGTRLQKEGESGSGGTDDPPGDDSGVASGSDDPAGDDSDVDDGDDASEDEIEIRRVEDGEEIEIKVRIRDGEIEGIDCSRSGDDEREAEARMTRTEDSDDADVTGKVEVESRLDRERFEVEVEHADVGRLLEAFVLDREGGEESLGQRTVDAETEAEWEIHSDEGGRLPFGVGGVADLEGMLVEVRDATTGLVLLRGEVPELPTSVLDEDEAREHGRAWLTPQVPEVEGYVEIRRREEEGELRQRFEVEAHRFAAGTEVEVWLEDPSAPGTLVKIATVAADLEGEAELEMDTHEGGGLPFGVGSLEDLVGLAVEVRLASDGSLLLEGQVPALMSE